MPLDRGIAVRRTNDPREERALREVQIANVFPEVRFGGLAESPDSEAAAVPEVNLVGVQFKNALLGETVVEFERHHGFRQLAAPDALRGEEKAARHLHVNGAGAFEHS